MDNTSNSDDPNSHCSVVGLIGILIQLSLGVLSFSVLILKRYFQKPRRPWKIWRFDTAKQVISQLLAHFINLTISLALTEEDPNSDTCLWYFITNIFDNTVGVFMCVLALRLLQKQFFKRKKYPLISGHYYEIKQDPIRYELQGQKNGVQQKLQLSKPTIHINYKAWFLQLLIWNSIVIVAKVLLFVLQFVLRAILDTISKILLGWIEAYPNLELVVVIVIVPVIMNGFAFWVQDNFLKKRQIPIEDPSAQIVHIQMVIHDQSDSSENKNKKQMTFQDKQTTDQSNQKKNQQKAMTDQ